jgi:hypothetical protein
MDPIAHASIGLIAKPIAPKAPLWALLAATQVPDLLFLGFQAAGIEHQGVSTMDLNQGLKIITLGSTPWSHALYMCLAWSSLVAVIAFLFYWDRRTSIAIGSMVFGHWVLDFIVYSDLPLFFNNSQLVGLGLLNSGPGVIIGILIEIGLIIGGIVIYLKTRKQTTVSAHG